MTKNCAWTGICICEHPGGDAVSMMLAAESCQVLAATGGVNQRLSCDPSAGSSAVIENRFFISVFFLFFQLAVCFCQATFQLAVVPVSMSSGRS